MKMKEKKIKNSKENSIKKDIKFCTECGDDLSQVGIFSNESVNEVKARHNKCKEIGKFKGDKCSMLFIVDEKEPLTLDDESD